MRQHLVVSIGTVEINIHEIKTKKLMTLQMTVVTTRRWSLHRKKKSCLVEAGHAHGLLLEQILRVINTTKYI